MGTGKQEVYFNVKPVGVSSHSALKISHFKDWLCIRKFDRGKSTSIKINVINIINVI